MFTGIVEEVGSIVSVRRGSRSSRLEIRARLIMEDIHIGDSIAVNGVCLTVTSFSSNSFMADVMHETLKCSNIAEFKSGTPVNLERAMKADGRFGGHIVSGHIDGTGVITSIDKDDNALVYTISATEEILRYIVHKGSVALDGISLTVKEVGDKKFSVSVIPHTRAQTTLETKGVLQKVNIENDCIGKYVERLLKATKSSNITREFLFRNGY
ncbi:MAG: riboflavin synthase [Filifactor alocis]|nr:riboflavin synthase [Filifactor alocis]